MLTSFNHIITQNQAATSSSSAVPTLTQVRQSLSDSAAMKLLIQNWKKIAKLGNCDIIWGKDLGIPTLRSSDVFGFRLIFAYAVTPFAACPS